MKKAWFISLLLCSLFLTMSSEAKPTLPKQSLDQFVAIVNDDVVTKSELVRAIALAKLQMTQEQLPIPSEAHLQKQLLDQLINKKLQLQIAKQAGIQISDTDLDKTIRHIAEQNNISVSMLYQRIHQEGMSTTDYRDELRDQLTLQKLQQQEVVNRINITPQELTTFMNNKRWQNEGPKEYHLEDIVIPISETPSSNEVLAAKKRAEIVISQLNQGQTFPEIAKTATDTRALQNDDLGWRKVTEIPSAFATQVPHMQPKQVLGPIQTSNGFHVIRLAAVRSIDATLAAPTRKQAEDMLLQQKFEEAVQTWVSKLRSQAFIVTNPTK